MLMSESEAKLIEIGRRYAAIDIQISNAYAAEQAKLQLEIVLTRERLSSEVGTIKSLAAISRIADLTKAHKELFQKVLAAFFSENAGVLAELPEDQKNEQLSGLAETLNWHLRSQSDFYDAREQWIDAAIKICNLIQSCRNTAVFGEAVQFANDEEFDEFERQMARIEDAHQREVTLMNEKVERLTKSLAVLGIQPSS
jgi:hypothetical protein